jgi:hypothetical protein
MADGATAKKLQIKAGMSVLVLNQPAADALGALPGEVRVAHRASGTFDAVVLFVRDRAAFARDAPKAMKAAKPGALIWVCWPKLSARTAGDLTRDVLFEDAQAVGLRAVTNVSIDDTWSALRFKTLEQFERGRKRTGR